MPSNALATREISRIEFIALLAAIMSLNALAIDGMLPALPQMGEALGVATENERQFVIAAYMLGFGGAQLAFGPISDRYGRRAPLVVGLVIYIACACGAAFAPDFTTLLVLRAVQGVGASATRVIANSVVRDRFTGRAMAEVMSLIFMVFMAVPVIAPGLGQLLLLVSPWPALFVFMAALAAVFGLWALLRLPETLDPARRRPLTVAAVTGGFSAVFANRMAFSYGLAGMFLYGALVGFINTAQQIYVDVFGLGVWFPVAFAAVAGLMALSSFLNSRIVRHLGMRRLSHGAVLVFTGVSAAWLALSLVGIMPLWLFLVLHAAIMFTFGWAASNMNSLSMEPLGAVAGTASSVFGFIQTVGGVVLGTVIGQAFDGTLVPVAGGYFVMGALALCAILVAENGRLFGVGREYEPPGSGH